MIDLTPLDVRKKRGDFRKILRGYDPQEVDTFLELVAERFEDLVRENLTLKERTERLESQVNSQETRERAVQQALVTAQELREEIRTQAQREAELLRKEAEQEIDRMVEEARLLIQDHQATLEELARKRSRFLRAFRTLLEKEMEAVETEEGRAADAAEPVELELSGGWRERAKSRAAAAARDAAASAAEVEERRDRREQEARTEASGDAAGTSGAPDAGAVATGEGDGTPAGDGPAAGDQGPAAVLPPPPRPKGAEPLWLSSVLKGDPDEEEEEQAG